MIAMDQRNAGGRSRAPDHRAGRLGQLHRRPHRAARPPAHRPVSPLRPVHRRVVHPEPDEGPARARRRARCWRSRSDGSARWRPAAPPRFDALGRDAQRSPGGHPGRCSTRSTGTSTRRASSTASTALSSRRSGRRVWCWPAMTRRTPSRSPRNSRSCFRTASSSPEWKTGAALEGARKRVREFLLQHTPLQG